MSLHRPAADKIHPDELDGIVRWALRDSVAGAEPSSQVWERIRQRVLEDKEPAAHPAPRYGLLSRRPWLGWLVGAGANCPVLGDPRSAWPRRLHASDVWAPLSVLIIEGKMPILGLVS